MTALIIPNADNYRIDTRYGAALQLLCNNRQYVSLSLPSDLLAKIENDYTLEVWFKLTHFSIIVVGANKTERAINPTLVSLPGLKISCDRYFIRVNSLPICRYRSGQWTQLGFCYGHNGTIGSTLTRIYINGQLIDKNKLPKSKIKSNSEPKDPQLPKLTINGSGPNESIQISLGANLQYGRNTYVIKSPDDPNQLEWSILRLYSKSLSSEEMQYNYWAHSSQLGLNRVSPHPITRDQLLIYYNINDPSSYQHPSTTINNIATVSPLAVSPSEVKKNSGQNIYKLDIMNSLNGSQSQPDGQVLSKVISQLLAKPNLTDSPTVVELINSNRMPSQPSKDPFARELDVIRTNPYKMRNILMYFQQNPDHLIQLIKTPSPDLRIFNAIMSQGKGGTVAPMAAKKGLGDIQSNPLKLIVLKEFFAKNPQSFIEILSSSDLNSEELSYLLSVVSQKGSTNMESFQGSMDLPMVPFDMAPPLMVYDNNNIQPTGPAPAPYPQQRYPMPYRSQQQPQLPQQFDPSFQAANWDFQQLQQQMQQQQPQMPQQQQSQPQIMGTDNHQIIQELQMLRRALNPEQKVSQEFIELNGIESQLQKLMKSNVMSDKKNQIQLFQLIRTFQQLKNNIMFGTETEPPQNVSHSQARPKPNPRAKSRQLSSKLSMLDAQFKNMAKMCLHAPNILGYMTDGQHRVGLIDRGGHIDYIPGTQNARQQPYYIALRNSQTRNRPMLPTVIEYINRPTQKDHKLIGQVIDSTNALSVGLIMSNQGQQYLILINPVPKLPEIPVLAIVQQSNGKGNNMQPPAPVQSHPQQGQQTQGAAQSQASCHPNNQQCLQGYNSTAYNGDQNWIQPQQQHQQAQSSESGPAGNLPRAHNSASGQGQGHQQTRPQLQPQQPSHAAPKQQIANAGEGPSAGPGPSNLSDNQLLAGSQFDFLDTV